MSSLTIILIIVAVLALIIAPILMLKDNLGFKIPKDFENKQAYKDEDSDD
ncbi:DUF2897 family protein [Catenovulum maritimum]|nr:DUF2897 family protein [Catenovulum maritimum]